MYPVSLDDLSTVRGLGIGAFFHAASDVHRRLSDFIHQVVVHRRDEAIWGWRNWIREDPLVHPYRWLRLDLVPPAFFSASLILFLMVLVSFLILLPLLPEVRLPRLTGEVLADVVRRKGATAGSLDGWGWRELKVLPVFWYDGLVRVLTKVEEMGSA